MEKVIESYQLSIEKRRKEDRRQRVKCPESLLDDSSDEEEKQVADLDKRKTWAPDVHRHPLRPRMSFFRHPRNKFRYNFKSRRRLFQKNDDVDDDDVDDDDDDDDDCKNYSMECVKGSSTSESESESESQQYDTLFVSQSKFN